MKFRRLDKNFIVILGIDLFLLVFSLYLAHQIRFEFNVPPEVFPLASSVLPLILFTKICCFYYFDLYRGMWRYTSIVDLANVLKASSVSTLLILCIILLSHRFLGFSRTIFAIDWLLTILFIGGFRLFVRFFFEYNDNNTFSVKGFIAGVFRTKHDDRKRLIIVGAGNCGEKIYRDIQNNPQVKYKVVGFVDDHPVKVGKKIHGTPVLNSIDNIDTAVKKVDADQIIIAIPSATSGQMRRIVENCRSIDIGYTIMPDMRELINGNVTVNAVRDVTYRDIIGREAVRLDRSIIGDSVNGKVVLVTGAGGSIGSELCRQICRFGPERIILFEMAETPLFEIDYELREHFSDIEVTQVLGSIQSRRQLEKTFEAYRPDIVFHAAAYKHVPMLERTPWQAVKNNITGTARVVECSKKWGVRRFVFVSTDKAVRPTSVMGVSKRIAEILVQNQNAEKSGGCKTKFMIVRFGNVLGSAGSVIPLFRKQIADGGPVTVTHRDITRYFMTIPEACQLILQAGLMGRGGEIFILHMGDPVKIDSMARDLIKFSGFEPDVDIEIRYIGLRPGEKLFEELITEGEDIIPTNHEKIMVLNGKERSIKLLNGSIDRLAALADLHDVNAILEIFEEIVPEYTPDRSFHVNLPQRLI